MADGFITFNGLNGWKTCKLIGFNTAERGSGPEACFMCCQPPWD